MKKIDKKIDRKKAEIVRINKEIEYLKVEREKCLNNRTMYIGIFNLDNLYNSDVTYIK